MAKKKTIAAEPDKVSEVMEHEIAETKSEEKAEKAEKKIEKSKVLSSKKEICEFYGITDEELLSNDLDLSKYNLDEKETGTLTDWVAEKRFSISHEIDIDIYSCPEDVKSIVNKYGITTHNIACGKLDELTDDEKEIVVNYYNELVRAEMSKMF